MITENLPQTEPRDTNEQDSKKNSEALSKISTNAEKTETQTDSQTLHPHPDPQLIEKTDQGPLPIIDITGREPWQVYARSFNKSDKRPRIAIVITHLGLSQQTHTAIRELPASVTLGFAPYARKLTDWVQQARSNGHEVLIGLPMEPTDYPRNDPGPKSLMLTNSYEENDERLNWVLSRATGYIGVYNFMGTRFAAEKGALQPILEKLKQRGLMMLDLEFTPSSVLGATARGVGLPYAVIDILADAEPNRGAIDRQLAGLTKLASERKSVVAVLRPFPITFIRLKRWIKRLDQKKIVLTPLSAIAKITKPNPKEND